MRVSPALLADLRRIAAVGAPAAGAAPAATQVTDGSWQRQPLARGRLHQNHGSEADAAAAIGYTGAVTLTVSALPMLWIRTETAERQAGRMLAGGPAQRQLKSGAQVPVMTAKEPARHRTAAGCAASG